MVYTDAGEDLIASCPVCGYAANIEKATSRLDPVAGHGLHRRRQAGAGSHPRHAPPSRTSPRSSRSPRHPTSNASPTWRSSAAQGQTGRLARRRGLPARRPPGQRDQAPRRVSARAELRTMDTEELEQFFNGPAGYLGPGRPRPQRQPRLAMDLTVVVDKALEGRTNLVCGANKLDYHLRNVVPGRDFTWTLSADIRSVNEGEGCPNCGALPRQTRRRQSRRDRPHLQAGLQILGVHGRPRARRQRQGSYAHHGQLWHRHRAHSHLRHRAVQRRQRFLAAGRPSLPSPSSSPSPTLPTPHCMSTGEKLAAELERGRASTSCWMTETSAPASNSRMRTL